MTKRWTLREPTSYHQPRWEVKPRKQKLAHWLSAKVLSDFPLSASQWIQKSRRKVFRNTRLRMITGSQCPLAGMTHLAYHSTWGRIWLAQKVMISKKEILFLRDSRLLVHLAISAMLLIRQKQFDSKSRTQLRISSRLSKKLTRIGSKLASRLTEAVREARWCKRWCPRSIVKGRWSANSRNKNSTSVKGHTSNACRAKVWCHRSR